MEKDGSSVWHWDVVVYNELTEAQEMTDETERCE